MDVLQVQVMIASKPVVYTLHELEWHNSAGRGAPLLPHMGRKDVPRKYTLEEAACQNIAVRCWAARLPWILAVSCSASLWAHSACIQAALP